MNTVGKENRLGESIRCVVSVSMLTEGWDTNTVTHVLGVLAFGTRLLCEQVIGRALRRQSYDLNEEDLFNVEYADVLGIPFDFTARPVIAPPQPGTEGWDTNTVTHVLGVLAFGTRLLCEQVIGRALRRQSYDLNEEDLFNVEYADVLGIPFDFTARPVIAPPQPPRQTIQVRAVRPDRDELEIQFPRVSGYRVELPEERLTAEFNSDSALELTPEMIGPTTTRNEAIIGEGVDLNLVHAGDRRLSTVLFNLTQRLIYTR